MPRKSWRRWVAALAATAIGAPVIALSAGPVSAVSPTAATGTLVIGGEAECAAPSTDCNPWRFGSGANFSDLRNMLTDAANFSRASGTVKKASYTVTSITSVTDATLAGLDVFVAAIPIGGADKYSPTAKAALQNFVNNGGALVLLNNDQDFGETADWLGYTMRDDRAFYGFSNGGINDCGFPNTYSVNGVDQAPTGSVTVATGQAAHPVVSGPFGANGEVTVHHTVNAFTATNANSTSLYTLNVADQKATIALNGPRGTKPTGNGSPGPQYDVLTGTVIDLVAAVTTPAEMKGPIRYYEVANPGDTPAGPGQGSTSFGPLAAGTHYFKAAISHQDDSVTWSEPSNVIKVVAQAGPLGANDNSVLIANDDHCPGSQDTVDNNIGPLPVVSAIPAGALGANSGPVVVTGDLDLMSNAYQRLTGDAAPYAPLANVGNAKFALNVFAWIMDQLTTDTYFNLPNLTRVYDSRSSAPLVPGETRNIQVSNIGGVPANAKSIIANVTAVDATVGGYFSVWPKGQPQPDASTHNFGPGENFANLVVVPVGLDNSISIFNSAGETDVLVDIVGYTTTSPSGGRLRTQDPVRVFDTRTGVGTTVGKFGAGTIRDLSLLGAVPGTATAALLNLTVANPDTTGSFITVWPSGSPQPNTSNLNVIAGVNRPNLVVAPIGANGKVSIYNYSGQTDIIADLVGYFDPTGVGGSITGVTSSRIFNTRTTTPFGPGETRTVAIKNAGIGVPDTAKTVIVKVTVDQPTGVGGFLTVWPEGDRPNVSNLNFEPGMTIPNIVVTKIGADGAIRIYNYSGSTDVLVDILGYAD